MARLAAGLAPYTLRQQRHFTAFARENGEQAVGLALVAALEHNGRDAVQPLAAFIFGFHGEWDYTIAGLQPARDRQVANTGRVL